MGPVMILVSSKSPVQKRRVPAGEGRSTVGLRHTLRRASAGELDLASSGPRFDTISGRRHVRRSFLLTPASPRERSQRVPTRHIREVARGCCKAFPKLAFDLARALKMAKEANISGATIPARLMTSSLLPRRFSSPSGTSSAMSASKSRWKVPHGDRRSREERGGQGPDHLRVRGGG